MKPQRSQPRPGERLQKILARAGVASRRKAEALIRSGRVTLNGQVAQLGDRAQGHEDSIKVDGKRVRPSPNHHYLLLNKPRQAVSTRSDPEGRSTVLDFVPPALRALVFPVGRLDYQTEGLLLLTSDGELAQRITHPRYGCLKKYEVKVKGQPDAAAVRRLRGGIVVDGKRTAPSKIRALRASPPRGSQSRTSRSARAIKDNSWWIVELQEGRSRQIREMFFRVGHPVQRLRRVAIGPLADRHLRPGSFRPLSLQELELLRKSVRLPARPSGRTGRSKPTRSTPRSSGAAAGPAAPGATPLIVAIDGPSGVGKSTAARRVAQRLQIPYLETGAMYRTVGLKVLEGGIDATDPMAVDEVLQTLDLSLRVDQAEVRVVLEGEVVGEEIRAPAVGEVTSKISAHPAVRKRLVALQRETALRSGGVIEGRDIGTVVCPETPHKFFFEAPLEVRIERRFQELRSSGEEVSYEEVAQEMQDRDARDRGREDSPLTQDASYELVDTSKLSADEVVEKMVRSIRGQEELESSPASQGC